MSSTQIQVLDDFFAGCIEYCCCPPVFHAGWPLGFDGGPGAVVGAAGICIVWVLPHMTDIGQLCALVALVSAGAGWIATSSERLAYFGMQIAFAFFLGVLQGYAPATDLSLLRDRVAGILLGNVAE